MGHLLHENDTFLFYIYVSPTPIGLSLHNTIAILFIFYLLWLSCLVHICRPLSVSSVLIYCKYWLNTSYTFRASPVAQWVKNLPAMQQTQETQVQSLGWEDHLEKEMATHSSILAWKIPWTKESGRLQSMGLQRVRRDRIWCTTSIHPTLRT